MLVGKIRQGVNDLTGFDNGRFIVRRYVPVEERLETENRHTGAIWYGECKHCKKGRQARSYVWKNNLAPCECDYSKHDAKMSEVLSALFLMALQHCETKQVKGKTIYTRGDLQAHRLAIDVLLKHGKITDDQVATP